MQVSYKSDVWQYGITVIEIFSAAATPYKGKSNAVIMELVMNQGYIQPRPPACPAYYYTRIATPCLHTDPELRPHFRDICDMLEHRQSLVLFQSADDDNGAAAPPRPPPRGGGCNHRNHRTPNRPEYLDLDIPAVVDGPLSTGTHPDDSHPPIYPDDSHPPIYLEPSPYRPVRDNAPPSPWALGPGLGTTTNTTDGPGSVARRVLWLQSASELKPRMG